MRYLCPSQIRKKAVWGPTRTVAALLMRAGGGGGGGSAAPGPQVSVSRHSNQKPRKVSGKPGAFVKDYKLDAELTRRSADRNGGSSKVIVTLMPGATLPAEFKRFARKFGSDGAAGNLGVINGVALDLPHGLLKQLASHPNVFRVHEDRPIKTHNYRTSVTVGATVVRQNLGYTGKDISIAVIDSGITTWHDDLTNGTATTFPYGNQRLRGFVDFVNGRTLPYDDNGHGSHVAGIIAGNGYDSRGQNAGIPPDANLISLKVLDQDGGGTISNIIAALNWVSLNAKTCNIRVVNMSVAAPVRESYWTDPLTLAVKRITDQGIVVVAAAGNLGKNAAGELQYGAITAPANAPWGLTVRASRTMGPLTRSDETLA